MARRATSLGPKSSFFIFCFVFFSFPFFASNRQNPVFPLEKGIFCLFLSVSLCFSLAFFGLTLFQFLFLCLSPVFFLFSFLSFFFAFFSFFVFLSFFPFLSSLLLFHERNNITKLNCYFFHKYFLFFGVSSLAFYFESLFLIFAFA